ncbi:MAG: hypothetical protein ACLUHA_06960 [Bacteroides stercoris]
MGNKFLSVMLSNVFGIILKTGMGIAKSASGISDDNLLGWSIPLMATALL